MTLWTTPISAPLTGTRAAGRVRLYVAGPGHATIAVRDQCCLSTIFKFHTFGLEGTFNG